MSTQIKQESLCIRSEETADTTVGLDDGTYPINVQIKHEKELIIDEQEADHQLDEYYEHDSMEYSDLGYSIEGSESNHANDKSYSEGSTVGSDYFNDGGLQNEDEADYKKIADLQKFDYIIICCPLCDQSMKTFTGWSAHLNSKHSDFLNEMQGHNNKCKYCPKKGRNNINNILHYFDKHSPDCYAIFQCNLCKYKAVRTSDIIKHLDDKHDQFNDLYRKCPLCDNVFGDRKQMRYHFQEKHHSEFLTKFSYQCHMCKHPRFSKETLFYEHLINMHHMDGHYWEAHYFKVNTDKYQCLKCPEVCHMNGSYTLLKHYLEHEDKSYWHCKYCLKKCQSSDSQHLCNKMYRHFEVQGPPKQFNKTEQAWSKFEDYIMHCCPYCSEEFDKFQEWLEHLRKRHLTKTLSGLNMCLVVGDIKKLRCLECSSFVVASFVDIYDHCFQHLPYKPYKCKHCLIQMNNHQTALKHYINKCRETNCPLFSSEELIYRNKLTKDAFNYIAIICFVCNSREFQNPKEIELHFKNEHNNFDNEFDRNSESNKIICKVCGHTVDAIGGSSAYLQHYIEHLGEGPFKCLFCQRSYESYERCRLHVNRFHNSNIDQQSSADGKLNQRIRNVSRGLGVSREKANILKEFSEFISYACPECDERFTAFTAWSEHIKSNHTFFDESNLSFFDTVIGKHKCNVCKLTLCSTVSQRQKHVLTHMANKSFVCNLCHARATTNGVLYGHLRRVHFLEGDYECPICSFTLNNSYERSVHVKKTHPRSEWPKTMCLLCFRNYKNLRGHMQTHDADRPKYQCPVCNVTIINWGDLKCHMRNMHNQELDESYRRTQIRLSGDNAKLHTSSYSSESEEYDDDDVSEEHSTSRMCTRSMRRVSLSNREEDATSAKKIKQEID